MTPMFPPLTLGETEKLVAKVGHPLEKPDDKEAPVCFECGNLMTRANGYWKCPMCGETSVPKNPFEKK